jgi:pimeloyl-ACP methyl ester carboxylesterase
VTQIVLVHGAWHGAWCWDGVLAELHDRQVDAFAVELPFTGFEDDVDAVRSAIGSAGEPVVVCAHSYGGAVVSQAAVQLQNVGHLVYLAAFVQSGAASALVESPITLLDAIAETPAAPRAVPSTYIVCSRDGAIPPEAQWQMAQGLDRVVVWPTDHSPFLTRPADLAELLERTLDAHL